MTVHGGQADPLAEAAAGHRLAETVFLALLMRGISHDIVKVDVLSEPRGDWVRSYLPSQRVLFVRGSAAFSEEIGKGLMHLRDPLNGMLLKTFHV